MHLHSSIKCVNVSVRSAGFLGSWSTCVLGSGSASLLRSHLHTSSALHNALGKFDAKLIKVDKKNNVTTLTMNDPKKLNGWTGPMMITLRHLLKECGTDNDTKVIILTGSDPYYCAGVNLAATMAPMHPKKLRETIKVNNQALFDAFFDCPKPILIAANGPAIGACVTSATTCDAIIASEKATFNVPFAVLGVPPEGCSSVHFERMMGKEVADKLLNHGWKPSGKEAVDIGMALEVVPHENLMTRAQEVAEGWAKADKQKCIPGGGTIEEYKKINARESEELADAFLSYKFLNGQYNFLMSKGKKSNARVFWWVKTLRPIWSKML